MNGPGYALINAGAGWASKRWSPAKNALLAAALMERGRPVVFLGAPGDRPIFEEVQSHCTTPPVDMVGHTNVAELTALIHGCAVHIGGDTGSTHIAAALGRPCVGIYKVNDPRRTCPYGQFIHTLEGDPSSTPLRVTPTPTMCLGLRGGRWRVRHGSRAFVRLGAEHGVRELPGLTQRFARLGFKVDGE